MLPSRGARSTQRENVAPKKRVTFSGPVTPTRVNKPRPVGTEARGMRLKNTVNLSPPSAIQDVHRKPPLSERSQFSRPHSKTTVLGTPLKTRLNCNHLRPKCICSFSANKKRAAKGRQRKSLVSGPRSTLLSTRTLPRGEINGRKTYLEKSDAVSVLDGNWQPGLEVGSVESGREVPSEYNIMSDDGKENSTSIGLGDGNKKTVKFADSTRREQPRRNNSSGPHRRSKRHNEASDVDGSHAYNRLQSSYQTIGDVNSKRELNTLGHHSEPRVLSDNGSTSFTDNQKQTDSSDYCRLCELARIDLSEDSVDNRESTTNRTLPPYYADIPDLPAYLSDEPCLLCRRYGKDHYYINDNNHCELCERDHRAFTSSGIRKGEKPAFSESLPACHPYPNSSLKEDTKPNYSKTRPSLHRQSSSPGLYTKREESERPQTIPYEPRTDLVKDLKKRLEAEYRRNNYQAADKRSDRQWKSWDAEDTRLASTRHRILDRDPSLSHKCIHRYQQNDRLFLEPTVTNKEGRSVCSQCGAPQPSNPHTDPYLYHITLGGINDNNTKSHSSRSRVVQNPLTGN